MKDWIMICIVCLIMVSAKAYADPHHWNQHPYTTEVVEVTNVTEIVNITNIENYSPDKCAGVAISQAGANNQMYMGTEKPQLSLGVGECSGEFASSLMFGMKVKNNLMINGSFAKDEDVSAFGVGMTVIFK